VSEAIPDNSEFWFSGNEFQTATALFCHMYFPVRAVGNAVIVSEYEGRLL